MKDIITVSTVTFNASWGEKEKNLDRIMGYIEAAAKKGSDIVIFPEMALTGYDNETDKPRPEKMQTLLAETIPGPSTLKVEELVKKLGIYAVFGMPERCICLLPNPSGRLGVTSLSCWIPSGVQ